MKKRLSLVGLLCIGSLLSVRADDSVRFTNDQRRIAYQIRQACAYRETLGQPNLQINNLNPDEENVPNYAGSFHKGLEHDAITGALTSNGKLAFQQMVTAMESGAQASFNAIDRAPGATRRFTCPQGGLMFSLQGKDSSLNIAHDTFSITSKWGAANLLEIYWEALARDVLFSDYGTGLGTDANGTGGSITADASAVLQDFGTDYKGPRTVGNLVTPAVVFRGNYPGALVGPYISQFFWQNQYRWHIAKVEQLIPAVNAKNFGVVWSDFVALENGTVPRPSSPSDFGADRHIVSGRDLAHAVHDDCLYESYFTAADILTHAGFPYSPTLPYNNGSMPNEDAFCSLGKPDAFAALGAVSGEALKAAWANKWRGYRQLRPEAFGGLAHQAIVTESNPYGLDASLFALHGGVDTFARVLAANSAQATLYPVTYPVEGSTDTYLLAQAYPEASPLHPTFTSGHATVGGACVTVLKAYFNDQVLFKDHLTPVQPDPSDPTVLIPLVGNGENVMTLGGELDKIATNVAAGRNWSGIHYRTDADYGMLLGEQVAIAWLIDQARLYNEQLFTGFEFTTFNGVRINVSGNGVTVLS